MMAPSTQRVETSRARSALSIALVAAIGLLALALAARVAWGLVAQAEIFSYPFQLDESEGMIVAETLLLDHGTNIFDPVTPDLFIAAPYPPAYYLAIWPFHHLIGDEPSFKIGRALTLFATLIVAAAIFGIAVSITRSRLGALVGALAFLSLSVITFWGSLVKPDMSALALGLCGLWWLLARPQGQAWWALVLFLLAFYTKQTAIAAAAAGAGWLLFTRPRLGLGFGAAYAAGIAVPSLLLNWATRGGYFYHMFTIHDLPWFGDRFVRFLSNFLIDYGALLVPGILAIVAAAFAWLYARVRRRDSGALLPRATALMLVFYLGMSLLVSSGTGTLGGNHNHLLDLAAAACLGVGVGFGVVRTRVRPALQGLGVATAVLGIVWTPALFSVPPWLQIEFNQLKPERTEGLLNVFQYVTNNPGSAYSDNVGLMIAARKRLWSTDPFTQTHATALKRWDQSKLLKAIRSHYFSQIVLRIDVDEPEAGAGDVSPEILQAVREHYKLDKRNVLNVYVPR